MFKVGDEVLVNPSRKFGIYEYDNLGADDVLRVREVHLEEEYPYYCISSGGMLFHFHRLEIIPAKPVSMEDLI